MTELFMYVFYLLRIRKKLMSDLVFPSLPLLVTFPKYAASLCHFSPNGYVISFVRCLIIVTLVSSMKHQMLLFIIVSEIYRK